VDKSHVQGSVLLPMIASLFEQRDWQNATKRRGGDAVRDVRLSLLGCCTTETYQQMWTSESIAIGFPNRLFVAEATRRCRVAWPLRDELEERLARVRGTIMQQLSRLPMTLPATADAKTMWESFYIDLPVNEHAKRLDT